ncbi:MAG TPA: ATP-binding cassette domain-containing protein [Kofleriaceae bacterium]|nr:ATP-binding cassette domain-containing protein [Kofleriaceae bacterium]
MKAIETTKLSKRYGAVVALSEVSFSVARGEVIGLLGPNGAGKTTLMKILTGFLQPDDGEARVGGEDVVTDPLKVQARIGYLPEHAPLYSEMAVQEYLQMMAYLRGVPEANHRRYISDAVFATGLEGYLTRPIGQLSKGYRQRVGIAQAILHKPELLILDEPTTGLDPRQIVDIRRLIRRLSKTSTVVLSTHILPEVEITCERVLILMHGKLRADARLDELTRGHAATVDIAADAPAAEVEKALAAAKGADAVRAGARHGDYRRYRVTAKNGSDLCPAIFDALKDRGWRVGELKNDAPTLESVFRELAESVHAEDPAVSGAEGSGEHEVAAKKPAKAKAAEAPASSADDDDDNDDEAAASSGDEAKSAADDSDDASDGDDDNDDETSKEAAR